MILRELYGAAGPDFSSEYIENYTGGRDAENITNEVLQFTLLILLCVCPFYSMLYAAALFIHNFSSFTSHGRKMNMKGII